MSFKKWWNGHISGALDEQFSVCVDYTINAKKKIEIEGVADACLWLGKKAVPLDEFKNSAGQTVSDYLGAECFQELAQLIKGQGGEA